MSHTFNISSYAFPNKIWQLKGFGIKNARSLSTTAVGAITTRELRTFRALYGSREFLSKLQPTPQVHVNSSLNEPVVTSRDLRTFYIPASLSGWNGSNAKVQQTSLNLLATATGQTVLSGEAQQLFKLIKEYQEANEKNSTVPTFQFEVLRLSQRQVRRLTAGSHLQNVRSLLQGGVFQVTLKAIWTSTVTDTITNALIADLLRFVGIRQFSSIRFPATVDVSSKFPVRAVLLSPTLVSSLNKGQHSTVWRGTIVKSLNHSVQDFTKQLVVTTTGQPFIPVQALASAISPDRKSVV